MKIDRETIGKRIKTALDKSKITQRELSKLLGISEPSVSAYIQGASMPSVEAFAVISDSCKVSIDWIITGTEQTSEVNNDKSLAKIHRGETQPFKGLPEGYAASDVYLLGGAGNPHDLTSQEPIDTIFLPRKFLKTSILSIQIAGRSMEPVLFNGAFIGVDREERKIISGEIYAVYLPYEGIVVKRIYMSADHVILKSDNPSFPDLSISIEKIDPDNFVLGRAKWVFQEI